MAAPLTDECLVNDGAVRMKGDMMSTDSRSAAAIAVPVAQPITIPVAQIIPWALLAAVIAALSYYFVGTEQGATALFSGMGIHEFVHDARHLLGFPCH